jgi:pyruvate dehydrogenase E2 component (dihydrolipoamide acetyltransferase)
VQVGSVIAVVGEEGDDLSGAAELAQKSSSKSSEPPEEKAVKPSKDDVPPEPKPSESVPENSRPDLPTGDRIFASPIAKKIALERGIPLGQLKGSGPHGRIIREDVEKYRPSSTAGVGQTGSQPSQAQLPEYTDTPLSNMRRTIGKRLLQSTQELPHYYLTVDINMNKVLKLREVFNKALVEKDKAAKLSVNDFIVKAVACALADVPEANSAWLGEVIRT